MKFNFMCNIYTLSIEKKKKYCSQVFLFSMAIICCVNVAKVKFNERSKEAGQ